MWYADTIMMEWHLGFQAFEKENGSVLLVWLAVFTTSDISGVVWVLYRVFTGFSNALPSTLYGSQFSICCHM